MFGYSRESSRKLITIDVDTVKIQTSSHGNYRKLPSCSISLNGKPYEVGQSQVEPLRGYISCQKYLFPSQQTKSVN